MDCTRTLEKEYLTVYRDNSLFIYTEKLSGELLRFELFQSFAQFIMDPTLKGLLSTGDLNLMRRLLGPEDAVRINADEDATEYVYERRGILFLRYSVAGKTINALRIQKIAGQ